MMEKFIIQSALKIIRKIHAMFINKRNITQAG